MMTGRRIAFLFFVLAILFVFSDFSFAARRSYYTTNKPSFASRAGGNRGWKTTSRPKYRQPTGTWYSENEDAKGERWIEISLGSQTARFYKGDALLGRTPISSGMEGRETPRGTYEVLEKEQEHYSNLYGEFVNSAGRVVGYGAVGDTPPSGTSYRPSPMPHFLRLSDGGVGMHGGFLPGYPASHGCIRLPYDMAAKFYRHARIGMKVVID